MKILFVSHYSGLNGAPRSMVELINELKRVSIEAYVILPQRGKLESVLRKNKIKYYIVPFKPCAYSLEKEVCLQDRLRNEIYNLKAIQQIAKLINELKIDIVHSNSFAVNVGASAAFLMRRPHIWHFREFMDKDFNIRNNLEKKDVWLARRSCAIIANSDAIKRYYKNKFGLKNIVRIYNGIPVDKYYISRENFFTHDKLQFLIAGSFSPNKGQENAIMACKYLVDNGYTEFELNIVGEGYKEYVASLKRLVQKNHLEPYIKFLGAQTDMVSVRQNMDVELVCSVCEAFGRVTIEAMAGGLLVIGANTGGTKEIIQHQSNGLLYEQSDVKALFEAMKAVYECKEQYIEIIREGAIEVSSKYDTKIMSEKIRMLYSKIVK